jgi:hypothetical protein
MLAALVDEPFDRKTWVYETKRDRSRLYSDRCSWCT